MSKQATWFGLSVFFLFVSLISYHRPDVGQQAQATFQPPSNPSPEESSPLVSVPLQVPTSAPPPLTSPAPKPPPLLELKYKEFNGGYWEYRDQESPNKGFPLYHLVVHPSDGEWLETPIRVHPTLGFYFSSGDRFDIKWGTNSRENIVGGIIICPCGTGVNLGGFGHCKPNMLSNGPAEHYPDATYAIFQFRTTAPGPIVIEGGPGVFD
jgi:hypothetical protein